MRKFIQVQNGIIMGTLVSAHFADGDVLPDGLIEVAADTDLTDAAFRSYANGVIGEKQVEPVRVISRDDFLDRITIAEEATLRMIGEDTNVPAQTRAVLASFTARIYARMRVSLDDPRLLEGLALCKQVGVWPDEATADARIAAILA